MNSNLPSPSAFDSYRRAMEHYRPNADTLDDQSAVTAENEIDVWVYDAFGRQENDDDYFDVPGDTFYTRRLAHKPYVTFHNGRYVSSEGACATISVGDAAKIIGCAKSTLYQAITEGNFPHLKIATTIRIPLPALERMLATGDMNPKVTEQRVTVDENMAQRVAEIVVAKMLSLEQQRLTEQIKAISPGTYVYGVVDNTTAK